MAKRQKRKKSDVCSHILRTLKANKRFQTILRNKKVKISFSGSESYNYSEREGAPFEVQGGQSYDVYAEWRLQFWNPFDWLGFIQGWIDCISSAWEFKDLKWIIKYNPFRKGTGWVWCVESMDTARWQMAMSIARQRAYPGHYIPHGEKTEIEKSISKDFLHAWLDETHTRISKGMWVGDIDPTVMIVDPEVIAYDMRDGWSYVKTADIIQRWFHLMGYKEHRVKSSIC